MIIISPCRCSPTCRWRPSTVSIARSRNSTIAVALRAGVCSPTTGMTVAREDLALEAAFWAQLPGNSRTGPERRPITSRNFAAMVGLSQLSERARATEITGVMRWRLLMTSARSPYYFSLHASDPTEPDGGSRKDTGHTFICGPTGSGKTVFIGFMIAMLADAG